MPELATKVTRLARTCADRVVYRDGTYVAGRDAAVPVWVHGLLCGDRMFEGIRLCTADEVFLCRPAAEVVPVGPIDVRVIGDALMEG